MGCCSSTQSKDEDDANSALKETRNLSQSKSEDGGKLVPVTSKRDKFFATYRHQNFDFRGPLMYYIAMNPSTPEVYQKLIQTCKYFYAKNPILVVPDSPYYDGNLWTLGETSFDLNEIACKFWITESFHTHSSERTNAVIPKLFRCAAWKLSVNDQTISFHHLLLLVPSAKWIVFKNLIVKDENDIFVPLEKVFEAVVKARGFSFNSLTITSKTVKELIKIPHFSKVYDFTGLRLSEGFDLDAFYDYMKKNQSTHFWLTFDDSISDAYKTRLEEIVDEIIATKEFYYKPPSIDFNGLDREKQQKLKNICRWANVKLL